MSLTTRHFNLSIVPNQAPPLVSLSQNDNAVQCFAHLIDENFGEYLIPNGATATIEGINNDKIPFTISADSIDGNVVAFTPKNAMTSCYGRQRVTLTILNNGEQFTSLNIIFNIQKKGLTQEQAINSNEFKDAVEEQFQKYIDEHGLIINDFYAGHVSELYGGFKPAEKVGDVDVSTNYIGTKINDGIWHFVTENSALPTRIAYNIPVNMRDKKWRVAIENKSTNILNLDENLFGLKFANINADDYTSFRYLFSGKIKSGETGYWDFCPKDYIGESSTAFWLYFYSFAQNSFDIAVSVGILQSIDVVLTADTSIRNDTTLDPKDLSNLNFTKTGVVDGVRRSRPHLASSKLLDLFDYMGMKISVKIADGWVYRLSYYETEDITGGVLFEESYGANESFSVRARYAMIYIKKENDSLILPEELDSAFKLELPELLPNNMYVRGNLCNPDQVSYGLSLDTSKDGRMVFVEDRAVTDFIKIPKINQDTRLYAPYKYLKACAFDKHALYADINGTHQEIDDKNDYYWGFTSYMAVFYDINKHYIGKIENNVTTWTRTLTSQEFGYPAGTKIRQRAFPSEGINVEDYYSAEYVRIVFFGTASRFYVGFGSNSALPDYEEYLPLDEKRLSIFNTVQNSDGAVTELIRGALQYANKEEFGYGNHYTAYHESAEEHEWDGIQTGDYDKVDYLNNPFYFGEKYQIDCSAFSRLAIQNIVPENSRYFNEVNTPGPCGHIFNSKATYVTEQGRLTANMIAKYAYENNWLYTVASDMSNVKVGDILFLSDAKSDWGMFKNIGHAMFVVQTWCMTDGSTHIYTLESSSTFPTVKRHIRMKDNKNGNSIIYGARFPYPNKELDITNIASELNTEEKTLTMAKNESIVLGTVSLSKPLKERDVYTVCIGASIPENTHLEMRIVGKLSEWSFTMDGDTRTGVTKQISEIKDQALGLKGSGIRFGNTKEYILNGITWGDVEITNPNVIKIILVADATINNETANISNIKVINGFYTPKIYEFN